MPYRTAAKNLMLDALAGSLATVSLHTAFPPSDANEIAATNGARQAISFGAAANGEITSSAEVTFEVPGGTTVSAVAYRDGAGAILSDDDVTDESFAEDGTYTVTASVQDLNAA